MGQKGNRIIVLKDNQSAVVVTDHDDGEHSAQAYLSEPENGGEDAVKSSVVICGTFLVLLQDTDKLEEVIIDVMGDDEDDEEPTIQ